MTVSVAAAIAVSGRPAPLMAVVAMVVAMVTMMVVMMPRGNTKAVNASQARIDSVAGKNSVAAIRIVLDEWRRPAGIPSPVMVRSSGRDDRHAQQYDCPGQSELLHGERLS